MTPIERNLSSLVRHPATLAQRLATAKPSPRVHLHAGRSGLPSASMTGERRTAMHSRIDPEREAVRLVQSSNAAGFVLVFGLGLGYHLRELLRLHEVNLVLAIDYDLSVARSLLEAADLSDLLDDRRLTVLMDPQPHQLETWIVEHWVPVLHGDLTSISLRGRVEQDPEPFAAARRTALGAASAAADELATQRAFGRTWMRNIALNVLATDDGRASDQQGSGQSTRVGSTRLRAADRKKRCVITAAGPSLDRDLELIRRNQRHSIIIATDSSLPALLAADLQPDVVLAIDCQTVSYLHVLGAAAVGSLNSLLVADIGVHHAVVNRFAATRFVGGNHPFVRYLVRSGLSLPFLDTSEGSVTHAAIRLAAGMGLRNVEVFGADFAYPRAAAYARGTYIHSHFLLRHGRCEPLNSRLLRFVLDMPHVEAVLREGRPAYVTALMRRYQRRCQQLIDNLTAEPRQPQADPDLVELLSGAATDRTEHTEHRAGANGRNILEAYLEALRALSPPRNPLQLHLNERAATAKATTERNLWLTLLPLAAACRRSRLPYGTAELLEQTRQEAITLLEPLLSADHDSGRENTTVP